jgi:hypothetical protein
MIRGSGARVENVSREGFEKAIGPRVVDEFCGEDDL